MKEAREIILAVSKRPGNIRQRQMLIAVQMDEIQHAGSNGVPDCRAALISEGEKQNGKHIITKIRGTTAVPAGPDQLMKTVGKPVKGTLMKGNGKQAQMDLRGSRPADIPEAKPEPDGRNG